MHCILIIGERRLSDEEAEVHTTTDLAQYVSRNFLQRLALINFVQTVLCIALLGILSLYLNACTLSDT